ncbi:MAG: hypothetical protein QNJ51_06300 [Calothrix sp. MO_167.B12]|nr:hypothetical protein [Calothrix sp. MO_167.B12]
MSSQIWLMDADNFWRSLWLMVAAIASQYQSVKHFELMNLVLGKG